MGMLQIKNFPDELKQKLAARAKAQGTTMSALVIDMVWADLSMPTMDDWWRQRSVGIEHERMIDIDVAENIRAEREEREDYLATRMARP